MTCKIIVVQGGPIIEPEPKVITAKEKQEMLDDIAEQLDIIARQVQDLINENEKEKEIEKPQDKPAEDGLPLLSLDVEVADVGHPLDSGGGGGGSSSSVIYSKILISEVQTAGLGDAKEEFVELYNPNDTEVDLTNWYLQKKTSGGSLGSFATKTTFSGKKINAKSYFLIARTEYFSNLANISVDNALSDDSTLILKNPDEDVVDKVGWGLAEDYELLATQNPGAGQSIGRKVLNDGTEEETDNNLNDFELQTPTPKAKNTVYIAPPASGGGGNGGGGDEPKPPVPEPVKTILINEIQTEGETVKDEFIELYNPNIVDVDLSGFYLKKKTSSGTESNLVSSASFTGTILAKSYFLIAPQNNDDESVNYNGLATPNLYYSGKTYSIASDNTILLYNNNDVLLDKVGLGLAKDFEIEATINPEALKSIERKIIGGDTDNNLADFRVSDNPTPGVSFMLATIEDITNYVDNFGDYMGARPYGLILRWDSKSPNLDFYQLQNKKNNNEWKDWVLNTTETQKDFLAFYSALLDENIYYFRVRAQDKDGNQGDWQEIAIDLSAPVVINEVALYGTNDNKDQWLELYNKTDKEVDLTGWKIVCDGLSLDLEGKILPKSYLLLENNVLLGKLSGKNLKLLNEKQRYIDVFYEPNGGWSEYNFTVNEKIHSLERVSPYSFGSQLHNWILNSASDTFATPGQQNSNYQIYTFLPGSFVEDESLRKSLSPYVIIEGVNVYKGATLTIEPGVVIKFYNATSILIVDGTVKAIGNSEEKIVFTSFADDDCGTTPVCGDSNRDGPTSSPVAGNWSGLVFTKESINSEFNYTAFYYSGYNKTVGVRVEQSSVLIKNSIFKYNLNQGLYLVNSSSTIDAVEFIGHSSSNIGDPAGIYIAGGSPHIINSYFKDNYNGILVDNWSDGEGNIIATSARIENNNFENNLGAAIFLYTLDKPYFFGNTASGNTFNDILIIVERVIGNITLQADTIPYLVRNILTVPEDMTLTLEPGVIMEFQSNWSGVQVDGTLNAIGTSEKPIIFRHYRYDKEGVGPGNWLGLNFSETSNASELENVDINLGGAFYAGGTNFGAAIKVDQSSISLKNSIIQKNLNNGLWLINSSSIVDNVSFLNNNTLNGENDNALFIEGGSSQVTNSHIEGSY